MDVMEKYSRWLSSSKVSLKDKEILNNMSKEQIDDAFFKNVEFGTAGMRGILGPGTNRLNEFTVRKATVAFAKYLLEKYPNVKSDGVVISHDNRHMSREFTLLSAETLNDFGIKTYIFDSLRPTPELSFAVRYLKCSGGIMITASHNPKEHNGYKVYVETGCQLVPDKISRLLEIIDSLPSELDVEYEVSASRGETILLDKTIDDEYVKLVESIAINKDLDKSNFKIVFTPNHGTSYVNAMRIFTDLGYKIYPVMSQISPDPDFSGTLSPNPEDARSFIEPLKLAKEVDADLVVMTDPDGDRVGLAFKDSKGEYQTLTGNQSGAMLMEYIFDQKSKKGTLSDNGVMYNTIVTSSLGNEVAKRFNVKYETFLTGFKFIGNRIDYYDKHGGPKFEFGYEESYGCLIAPFARDKDGCQAILMYCEMALFYFLQGKRLDQIWEEMGQRYGYHCDQVFSIAFEGSSGSKKMNEIMSLLHTNPFITISGNKVVRVEDYKKRIALENGKEEEITLPVSDVVKLYFSDRSIITVRPSGTEPKIKFYIGAVADKLVDASNKPKAYYEELKKVLGVE